MDGDADRLVYFIPGGESPGCESGSGSGSGSTTHTPGQIQIQLLDGDRVAVLSAIFLRELLDALPTDLAAGIKVRGRRPGSRRQGVGP